MDSLATIVNELYQARATQYGMAASATIVFYDVIITLPREVALIWPARRSLPKHLYLFTRYGTFLAMIGVVYIMGGFSPPLSSEACTVLTSFTALFAVIVGLCLGGYLITLRVYVLYKASIRHSAIFFGVIWLSGWLPGLVIMSLSAWTWSSSSDVVYLPIPGMCGIQSTGPSYLFSLWVWTILFQSIMCALLMRQAYQRRHLLLSSPSSLIKCLLVDGIFYNVVILALQIANLIFFLVLPPALFRIAFAPEWAISVVMISRIYLNLRNVANHREWTKAISVAELPNSDSLATGRARTALANGSANWSVPHGDLELQDFTTDD